MYAGLMAGCASQKPKVQPEPVMTLAYAAKPAVPSEKKREFSDVALDMLHVTMMLKYIEPSQKEAKKCLKDIDTLEHDIRELLDSQE